MELMINVMGYFFIIVSLLKMPRWNDFVDAFSKYDIIAKKSRLYAAAYPALEFVLGIMFLSRFQVQLAALITLIIMVVGLIGVIQGQKKGFKCACVGTLIPIPLTKFTIFEDVVMIIMALIILL